MKLPHDAAHSFRSYSRLVIPALVLLVFTVFSTLVKAQEVAVTGQVVSRITGLPLEGVTVSGNGGSAVTDVSGNYSMALDEFDSQEGSIYIYGSTIYRGSGQGGGSLSLVPPFPKQIDFTAVEAPERIIQGRVVDTYGNPVSEVQVRLEGENFVGDRFDLFSHSTRTGTDGVYFVAGSEITEEQSISGVFVGIVYLERDDYLDVTERFNPQLQSGSSFPFLLPEFSMLCVDNCPIIDTDNDSVGDSLDLCHDTSDGDTVDINGCSDQQVDTDDDGFCNPGALSSGPSACVGADNCPLIFNDQTDLNSDGYGDACVNPDSNVDITSFGSNPTIAAGVSVGTGTVFGNNATLGENVTVRRNVTVGNSVELAGDSEIRNGAFLGDNVNVSSGTIVSARVQLGDDVSIGENVIIRQDAVVGQNTEIGHNSVIRKGSQLSDNVKIGASSVLSRDVAVGENSVIGQGVKLRIGAVIGSDVLIGQNVLIRRDVVIGDGVQIGLDCLPATSNDDPPCVIVSRETLIGDDSVLGVNVLIRRNVIIPSFNCVEDGAVVPANTTLDSPCS